MSSVTSGDSIRYTTNGSTPTSTTGTVYSTPVSVSTTTTLKAIAYKTGSADSTVTSATYTINQTPPADIIAPTTPISLTGTASSPTTVSLTWSASADNVGVTGYRIYHATGTGTPAQIATGVTTTSYSDTGLTTGTSYTYQVAAYDAAGNLSPRSATATVLVHDETYTAFTAWVAGNFTPAERLDPLISGLSADPSGCGVPNLLRYACGLPARGRVAAPATVSIVTDVSQNYLALTFPRKGYAPDLEYIVQSSTDLITWTDLPTVLPGYPKTNTVRDVVPVSAQSRRFLRLRVTQHPER